MKSEFEIRMHRANLAAILDMPCDCAATGHGGECYVGREQMRASIMVLDWALGESPIHDEFADELAADLISRRA